MDTKPSPNFAYLAHHDPRLVVVATKAEALFPVDPAACVAKLRLFGELLAKRAAAKLGMLDDPMLTQQQLIDRLHDRNAIGATQRSLFHDLRRAGNEASHADEGGSDEALHQLRMARELGVWFQRTFGNNRKFDPGPFLPPPDPKGADAALHGELERLRRDVDAHRKELEAARAQAEELRRAAEQEQASRLTAEERAAKAHDDAAMWETLATDEIGTHRANAEAEKARARALEEQNKKLADELAALQAAAQASPKDVAEKIERAAEASNAIELDEAATRRIIDKQLRDAGWEADTERLTYESGVRPTKGRNLAIAEWPTEAKGKEGRADYVLFAGLQVVAVVEAKRKHKDVSSVIGQAKRYSAGYLLKGDEFLPEGSPWGDMRVPFLFATNGRPYLRQLKTKSGIHFLDARRSENHSAALEGWYTPEGLLDLLKQNVDDAHAKLKVEAMDYIDRDYQRRAILAVESALERGAREALVAMATGTGKTRTCIGFCYRVLKTRRFRRVLFLVDRSALGVQTANALKELRLENLQTFPEIFDVKELGDLRPERETRLHIATVQAMVKRVLGPFEGDAERNIPPVDQYDCIVVDECHRGYLLDRELSDREFLFRDEADYISKYRRVLDHFDAVKIGLTATPAVHTTEIFGKPVFEYSYREAVIDGHLVDHEPPIRIVTKLAHDGIHYKANEEVLVLDRRTQTLHKEELPDEVSFEVDAFNKRVITEPFNRAVLGEVVKHIDPEQDEKTLIFCATDDHADLVVTILKELFAKAYGTVDDDAVVKITGEADRPLELIRRYRNERHPSVAVTVDLLTTGIDVPRIANLVFLRRVRSRILYEQMLGRATRKCDEIHKGCFRIFDAVDLYSAIESVTDMKPVVVDPLVTFEQLAREILARADDEMRRESIQEFLAKLQRKKRSLGDEARERFETAAGMPIRDAIEHMKNSSVGEVADWLAKHPMLASLLDRETGGGGYRQIVSQREDDIREVTRGFGDRKKPEDYIEGFRSFLRDNLNKIPALVIVTQRPRELTREALRELKLALDQAGYNEAALKVAWHEAKNEDIAATIIGYIRQLALGSPLVPYAERVERAIARVTKAHKFTEPQRQWLDRIATQLKVETVVDHAALDSGQFAAKGGFARLNKVFDGSLDALLGEIADEVWKDAG